MWGRVAVDWIHKPLDGEEVDAVDAQIARNGRSLFEDQLIYHAWGQLEAEHLRRLTPDIVQYENTWFNLLVRQSPCEKIPAVTRLLNTSYMEHK